MPTYPSHAPADQFSPDRTRLTDLNASLADLRHALPILRRVAAGAHHGAISACTALLAFAPAHAIGLKESFWSAITAISVAQTEFRAARTTARDQFLGAAVGGLSGLCWFFALGQSLMTYAAAVNPRAARRSGVWSWAPGRSEAVAPRLICWRYRRQPLRTGSISASPFSPAC